VAQAALSLIATSRGRPNILADVAFLSTAEGCTFGAERKDQGQQQAAQPRMQTTELQKVRAVLYGQTQP